MARDRFIRFESQPKKDTVWLALDSFFGTWPGEIIWKSDRFFIDIPGKPNNPMHRQERFIEVWIGEKSVDVMTRQADHLVNAIADGLAVLIAHALKGKLEE